MTYMKLPEAKHWFIRYSGSMVHMIRNPISSFNCEITNGDKLSVASVGTVALGVSHHLNLTLEICRVKALAPVIF